MKQDLALIEQKYIKSMLKYTMKGQIKALKQYFTKGDISALTKIKPWPSAIKSNERTKF